MICLHFVQVRARYFIQQSLKVASNEVYSNGCCLVFTEVKIFGKQGLPRIIKEHYLSANPLSCNWEKTELKSYSGL